MRSVADRSALDIGPGPRRRDVEHLKELAGLGKGQLDAIRQPNVGILRRHGSGQYKASGRASQVLALLDRMAKDGVPLREVVNIDLAAVPRLLELSEAGASTDDLRDVFTAAAW